MRGKSRIILKWALYALLALLALLVQDTVLGGRRFFGGQLSLVPVAAVSVAVMTGAEAGSLFCLLCGAVYCLTGADSGPVTLVALTVSGALAGGLCSVFFQRSFVPCLLFCALALLLSDGAIFLLKLYFRQALPGMFVRQLLPRLGLSLASTLVFFPLSYAICRIGGRNG